GRGALQMAREQLHRSSPERVGLELDGRRAAREGCAVVLGDGRSVGRVTSGSFTPTLGKSIAMAYVEPAHAAVGTRLFVDIRGQTVPAVVVTLPFYRRAKKWPPR